MQIFLAPRSNETSYKNFLSTIESGLDFSIVEPYLTDEGKKLLEGFRNIKANKELVLDLLLKVSKIGDELIDHIDQMDLNPVFIYRNKICVIDAKLILK